MSRVPLAQLRIEDLRVLATLEERPDVELREALPDAVGDMPAFLRDVCAFANSVGGDIVFGCSARGSRAAVKGIGGLSLDAERARLDAAIREGIEPRVAGIEMRAIPGGSEGPVLVVRVPRSAVGPHLVRAEGRFYGRRAFGTQTLDVYEIRRAFCGDGDRERARRFRGERVARILARDTPVALRRGPCWAIHVVALEVPAHDVISRAKEESVPIRPPAADGWSSRFNFEGQLSFVAGKNDTDAYVQLFREGAIEGVDTSLLAGREENRVVPSVSFEQELLRGCAEYVEALRRFGVEGPLAVFVSLLGVEGYRMGVSARWLDRTAGFDRGELLLPEVIVDDETARMDALRPMLDILWQAAGWRGSPHFNANGLWEPDGAAGR